MSTTFAQVIAKIQAEIYQNSTEDITGEILQGVLIDMATFLKLGAKYGGLITPTTAAVTNLDSPAIFLATQKGTYTNFGNINIPNNGVHNIYFNGTTFSLATQTNFLDIEGDSETDLMHQKAIKTFVNDSIGTAIDNNNILLFDRPNFLVVGTQDSSNRIFNIEPEYKLLSSHIWIDKTIQFLNIDYVEKDQSTIEFTTAPTEENVIHFKGIKNF